MISVVFIIALLVVLLASNSVEAMNCSRGSYLGSNQCHLCPRGRYGNVPGLSTSQCTAPCPAGTYNDQFGAQTEDDCQLCPPGTYGTSTGLTSSMCTSACPAGRYNSKSGATSLSACISCPTGYYMWQCNSLNKNKVWDGDNISPRGKLEL